MESSNERRYESIRKALEGVGFKVDEIQKKEKKTIITVSCNEEWMKNKSSKKENGGNI